VPVTERFLLLHHGAHRQAIIAVEGIAFDDMSSQFFTPENMLETLQYGTGARPGRARDSNDGMFD
jgi:hypothetical protein